MPDRRVAPPAERVGDRVPVEGLITPNEVGHEDRKRLLTGRFTGRSVALLVGISGAVVAAAGGLALAAGLSLDGAFMIGMLSVAVFSTVTTVYKDLRKKG